MPEFDNDVANKYYELILRMIQDAGIPCSLDALVALLLAAYTAYGTMTEGQNGSTGPEHFHNPSVIVSFTEFVGMFAAEVIPAATFTDNDYEGPKPS